MSTTALTKALALAELGMHVFPVGAHKKPTLPTGAYDAPAGKGGFYHGTTDPDSIRQMWADYPGVHVGVWLRPSLALVGDTDYDPTKGKDGYSSLFDADHWDDHTSTVRYPSPSGGEHNWFKVAEDAPGPRAPYLDMNGFDRKSGDSYAVWYGEVPLQEEWDARPDAPEWLLTGSKKTAGASYVGPYEGDLGAWLNDLSAGPAIEELAVEALHYGDLVSALGLVVEKAVFYPLTPGLRATFDRIATSYMNSSETSIPEEDRVEKVFGLLRWWVPRHEAIRGELADYWDWWDRRTVEPPKADFWTRRPALRHAHKVARQTTTAPWAVLGSAIQRTLHTVPYTIGYRTYLGDAPLNSLVAFVGPTGGGKTLTQGVVRRAFDFNDDLFWTEPIEPGSGESMPDFYQCMVTEADPDGKKVKAKGWRDPVNHSQMFAFDEIGMAEQRAGRTGGGTLLEFMKQGWSGSAFGRVLAKGEGTMLASGTYRFGLHIAVQPARAEMLFTPQAISGGLPSRFLWFSTVDPKARAEQDDSPLARYALPRVIWDGVQSINALPEMNAAHRESNLSRHEGTSDELESHALLTRAKVAVALAVMDGRTYLNEEDWEISAEVMAHSAETRANIQKVLAAEAGKEIARAGKAQGTKTAIATEVQENHLVQKVAARIQELRELGIPDDGGKDSIKRRLRGDQRKLWDEAVALLR